MIYSTFGKPPRIWTQLPLLWKILYLGVILLYFGSFILSWLGAITGYHGYGFPILLTPVFMGGTYLLLDILLQRRRL